MLHFETSLGPASWPAGSPSASWDFYFVMFSLKFAS